MDKMKYEQRLEILQKNENNRIGKPYKEQKFATKKYSIDDYRSEFDSQNIALSKHEELQKIRQQIKLSKLQQTEDSTFIADSNLLNLTTDFNNSLQMGSL